ncbi:MAG: GntR family transcriptional regulator [Clostridia bacterium]
MPRLKSDLVDKIFDEIVSRINHYIYVSGDVVSEISLANEFSISRTPVREAIFRLIDIGLLVRDKSKVVVKSLNYIDIKEILEARLALEIMSARTIIQRGGLTDEEYSELISLQNEFQHSISGVNFEKNFELDANFHTALVKFSGNSRLIEFANRLNIQSDRFRQITMLTPSRHSITLSEHNEIIKSICDKNFDKTVNALTFHTNNSIKNYQVILDNDMWYKMIKTLKA